ncbi:MAG: hypothetical protein JO250_13365 [Armatimonadetes bacterium]|nr:hypothetical protein [Armatimonadota bacterium]
MVGNGHPRPGALAGVLLCAIIVPAIAIAAPPQAARQQHVPQAPHLSVHLGYTSEGTYRDVVLTGSTLRYTYNARNSLDKPGVINMVQAPHWTMGDLVTEQVILPPAEVAGMARVIRRTGFMRLRPVYGDRKGRAYGTLLQVTLGGRARKVLYLSGQRGGPAPTAFSAVESELVQIVNRNCKHKIS